MKIAQYLLDMTLVWTLLYLLYYCLLRKDTFFSLNRIFLLGALLLGLVIPIIRLLTLDFGFGSGAYAMVYPISNAVDLSEFSSTTSHSPQTPYWLTLIYLVYLAGILVSSLRTAIGLHHIYRLYQRGSKKVHTDFVLVKNLHYHLPFSFFKWIFWSENFKIDGIDYDKILAHESTHVKERHSVDILFLELLGVIFWWNPVLTFYKRSIRENHEFICDYAVGSQSRSYANLLDLRCQSDIQLALSNQFFQNYIKGRINMLKKSHTSNWQRWKSLTLIPVVIFIAMIFAFRIDYTQENPLLLIECISKNTTPDEQKTCTNKKVLKEIYQAIVYPYEARKKQITGEAVLGLTFSVDGFLDHKILHCDDDDLLDAFVPVIEKIRPLKFALSNQSTLSFSIPVKFIIEGVESPVNEEIVARNYLKEYPPFIIDDFVVVVGYPVSEKKKK